MVAKVLSGIAGTCILSVCGYFIATAAMTPSSPKLPVQDSEPLQTLASTTGSYSPNTLANSYSKYLLDPRGNQRGWEDRFRKLLAQPSQITSARFNSASIQSAFSASSSTNTALNNTCEEYYRKEVKKGDEDAQGKLNPEGEEWKDLWLLCSVHSPTMASKPSEDNSDYEENTIGKSKGHLLLSTKSNEALWTEKTADFFSLSAAPSEQKFREWYEAEKDKATKPSLKDKCEEFYKLKPQEGGSPSEDEVVKYCSMLPIIHT